MAGRKPRLDELTWLELLQLASDARDKKMGSKARMLVKCATRSVLLVENPEERYIAHSVCEGMLAALRKRFMRAELMLHHAVTAAEKAEMLADNSIIRLLWAELGVVRFARNKYQQSAHCFEKALELLDFQEQHRSRETKALLEKMAQVYKAMRCDAAASACQKRLTEQSSELSLAEKLHRDQVLGVPTLPGQEG